MQLTELIAQHVVEAFEGVNWTEVDLKNVLENVSFEQATTLTNASPNTIAAIVYHLYFYNEEMTSRAKGIRRDVNNSNGFDMPEIKNQNEWKALKGKMFESAKRLADTIKDFPEEKLFEPILEGYGTAYKNFHGTAEHVHYHLGQIFILKNVVRNGSK